jgi:hypothetical protein
MAFNLSMTKALTMIYDGGFIFEDDILLNDFFIPDLPDDWDMLYLGANLTAPAIRINEYIVKLTGAYTTHAILYREGVAERIIMEYDYSKIYDAYLNSEFIKKNNCYMVTPMQAYQRPSYSYILKHDVDYTEAMNTNYNKYINLKADK